MLVNVISNGSCNELGNDVIVICNGSCNEFFYVTGFGNCERHGFVIHLVLLCNLVIVRKSVNWFNGNLNVIVLDFEM